MDKPKRICWVVTKGYVQCRAMQSLVSGLTGWLLFTAATLAYAQRTEHRMLQTAPLASKTCLTGSELVGALADAAVQIAIVANDISISSEDWAAYEAPVTLNRNVTLLGMHDAPERWPLLDFVNSNSMIRLAQGAGLNISRLVLKNWRNTPHFQIPVGSVRCDNRSAAAPATRCWPGMGVYVDVGFNAMQLDAFGKTVPSGYTVYLHLVQIKCAAVMSDSCVQSYGAVGCYYNMFPRVGAGPTPQAGARPPPTAAAPAAGLPDGGGGGGEKGQPSSGSRRPKLLLPLLVGLTGGLLAAVLIGLGTRFALRRRWCSSSRQQQEKVPEPPTDSLPMPGGGGKSSFGGRDAPPLPGSSDDDTTATAATNTNTSTTQGSGSGLGGPQPPSPPPPHSSVRQPPTLPTPTQPAAAAMAQQERPSDDDTYFHAPPAVAAAAASVTTTVHGATAAAAAPAEIAGDSGGSGSGGGGGVAETSGVVAVEVSLAATDPPPAAGPGPGRSEGVSRDQPDDPAAGAAAPEPRGPKELRRRCTKNNNGNGNNSNNGNGNGNNGKRTRLTPVRPGVSLDDSRLGEQLQLLPVTLGKGSFGRVVEGVYGGVRVAVKLLNAGLLTNVDMRKAAAVSVAVSVAGSPPPPAQAAAGTVRRLTAAPMVAAVVIAGMAVAVAVAGTLLVAEAKAAAAEVVLHIGIQIARALSYLHPTILHRDLKPANVLISKPDSDKPVAKLADFGLSRLLQSVLVTRNPEVGTGPYIAPEVFDVTNTTVTDRADVYALGVVLWEMLTGKRPWIGQTTVQIAFAVAVNEERLPLHNLPEERCPPKLRALVLSCWDPDPARRPAAAEVVKALALVQEVGGYTGDWVGE
ncbi:hypothetical protein VOLCADRAFT_100114 [Volvox carteri f. nagariensis]|uniref:Protein kinase domain-containing protein n=1 Tax=Volvox carteri f. nagariensis TaxID=3068 RepID=D8UJG3_VOLCA|nr:uncharacterized protein VOLCADRAFT_100114 [Volvox carteri f. nagariensis]EFJ40138.1 hypothetical protein VOLCADRAFT_100114 [Volvox carteri f. nagariensis]|eukprot:XP_002958795.1 hypothetical protein VOLCADRAFT_100114 [Volvox carteri f. nagariensis]